MNDKVEELTRRTFSKEETKDAVYTENSRLQSEVYQTAEKYEKVNMKLEKLAHNNELLRMVVQQISGSTVVKRNGKVRTRDEHCTSRAKKRKTRNSKGSVTPRHYTNTTSSAMRQSSVSGLKKSKTIVSSRKSLKRSKNSQMSKSMGTGIRGRKKRKKSASTSYNTSRSIITHS